MCVCVVSCLIRTSGTRCSSGTGLCKVKNWRMQVRADVSPKPNVFFFLSMRVSEYINIFFGINAV